MKPSAGQLTPEGSMQINPIEENTATSSELSDNPNGNTHASPVEEDDAKDYSEIGAGLVSEIMESVFGGRSPECIISTLGQPNKKEETSEYIRWFFDQGVEVDVVSQNDIPTIFNYIYILIPRAILK